MESEDEEKILLTITAIIGVLVGTFLSSKPEVVEIDDVVVRRRSGTINMTQLTEAMSHLSGSLVFKDIISEYKRQQEVMSTPYFMLKANKWHHIADFTEKSVTLTRLAESLSVNVTALNQCFVLTTTTAPKESWVCGSYLNRVEYIVLPVLEDDKYRIYPLVQYKPVKDTITCFAFGVKKPTGRSAGFIVTELENVDSVTVKEHFKAHMNHATSRFMTMSGEMRNALSSANVKASPKYSF